MGALEDLRKYMVDELEDIQKNVLHIRNELNIKITTAKTELKNEWGNLDNKYQHYENYMKQIRQELTDDSEDLLDEARVLGKELLTRYGKVKALV